VPTQPWQQPVTIRAYKPEAANRSSGALNCICSLWFIYSSDRRNEDQTDSTIQGTRTSSRPKRLPNTRSEDFLWV